LVDGWCEVCRRERRPKGGTYLPLDEENGKETIP
jgi:hypothetical protein